MIRHPMLSLLLTSAVACTAPNALAGGGIDHSSRAIQASAEALGHMLVGGVKVVSGVVAVPLGIVGGVGTVSQRASEELWREANTSEGPLRIDDEVVTAGPPPSHALNSGDESWNAPSDSPSRP